MAKVVFGNGVSSISGSIAGNTYSRNRFGPYIRTRALPVNPNTAAQQLARSRFSTVSAQWRQLTQAQRDSWENAGEELFNSNPQGFPAPLSGAQAFAAYNNINLLIGNSITTTAPAVDKSAEITAADLVLDTGGPALVELDSITGEEITDNLILIYATGPVSPGRSFFRRSDYRYVGAINENAQPFDLTTEWTDLFGSITAALIGRKTSFLLRGLSGNGWPGTTFRKDGIWVA